MDDLISRQALCEYALNQKDKSVTPNDIMRFPSAQPGKRTEERTETHACDLISRQAAIDAVCNASCGSGFCGVECDEVLVLRNMPPAQPEPEPVGCSGCRYERFGNRVCDVCSRFYVDRYEAERRTDG